MKTEKFRACGICGERDIPFGVDWPWWQNGKPVHTLCALSNSEPLFSLKGASEVSGPANDAKEEF